jgi:hypothetical protein
MSGKVLVSSAAAAAAVSSSASGGDGGSGGTAAAASSSSAAAAVATAAAPAFAPREQQEGPLRKLTTGLLATYKLINARYYDAKKNKAKAGAAGAVKEDYVVTAGDLLAGRYKVEESMGKGSFGQVRVSRWAARGSALYARVCVCARARERARPCSSKRSLLSRSSLSLCP